MAEVLQHQETASESEPSILVSRVVVLLEVFSDQKDSFFRPYSSHVV